MWKLAFPQDIRFAELIVPQQIVWVKKKACFVVLINIVAINIHNLYFKVVATSNSVVSPQNISYVSYRVDNYKNNLHTQTQAWNSSRSNTALCGHRHVRSSQSLIVHPELNKSSVSQTHLTKKPTATNWCEEKKLQGRNTFLKTAKWDAKCFVSSPPPEPIMGTILLVWRALWIHISHQTPLRPFVKTHSATTVKAMCLFS